jgi:hypothetical protein
MAEPAISQKLSALFPQNILCLEVAHNVKLSPVYDISWPLPTTLEPINLLDKGHIPERGAYLQLMALF